MGAGHINGDAIPTHGQTVHRAGFALGIGQVLQHLPAGGIQHHQTCRVLGEEQSLVGGKPDVHRPAAERQRLTGGVDKLAGRHNDAAALNRPNVLLLERIGSLRRTPFS